MPLILAIEPDPRQAAQIAAIVRHRIGAELMLAGTTEQALDVIGDRVPDLVLVPALLSPQDDAALAAALRVIAAAAHVRTLTIPVLGNSASHHRNEGMLAKWRRGRADSSPAPDGCDPAIFAEQISAYLREAAAERAALEDEPEPLADEAPVAAAEQSTEPMFETDEAALAAFAPAEDEQPALAAVAAEPAAVQPVAVVAEAESVTEQPLAAGPAAPVDDDPEFSEFPVFPTLPAFATSRVDEFTAPTERELASFSMPKASSMNLDLSGELDEDEAVFELEVGAATAMVFDDPAVVTFDAPSSSRPRVDDSFDEAFDDAFAELLDEPVEPPAARQLAQHADDGEAAPADTENETIAEIFAALSTVDPFNVRDARTAAAPRRKTSTARGTEPWNQLPFGSGRAWPRLEGVAAEFTDAAEQAATGRARPPQQKTEAPKADRPEWSALIASLRQDIERLRGEHQTPAAGAPAPAAARAAAAPRAVTPAPARPAADPNARKLMSPGGKPAQDEWGFFDPEQCGFAALLAKLNEITETGDENDSRVH